MLTISPSDTMIAAAPEGTPPRRIGEKLKSAPPCLAEALSGSLSYGEDFHGMGVNSLHVCFNRVIFSKYSNDIPIKHMIQRKKTNF